MNVLAIVAVATMGALTVGSAEWKATLQPAHDSGVSGSAQMEQMDEGDTSAATAEYRVAVTIVGAKAGAKHGWRVRSGRCDEAGGMLGSAAVYAPIAVDERGGGAAMAEIEATIVEGTAYSVEVHAAGASQSVACGEFEQE